MLNVADGHSREIKMPGTDCDNGWITVESKKEKKQAKRMISRVNAGKTPNGSVSRLNGERNIKRVSFAESRS